MNELALFAGAGGGILGGLLCGWKTVCAVEKDEYAASILCARQNDSILAPFPIWDDVCTFDGKPWCGIVDVVSGGFPCQDISLAGKRKGITGAKSGLWKSMARIINEVRPKFAFVENSALLISNGLATVVSDLTEMGYDIRWGCFTGYMVSAVHKRERIFILAKMADADCRRQHQNKIHKKSSYEIDVWEQCTFDKLCDDEAIRGKDYSDCHRTIDDISETMDRLKAVGNGQIPAVAAIAWKILLEGFVV